MPPKPSEQSAHPTQAWPALPQAEWGSTCATLQLWMQIVGKIRLALMPPINHCWGVTLYPTVRGLTTSPMPYGQPHSPDRLRFRRPLARRRDSPQAAAKPSLSNR